MLITHTPTIKRTPQEKQHKRMMNSTSNNSSCDGSNNSSNNSSTPQPIFSFATIQRKVALASLCIGAALGATILFNANVGAPSSSSTSSSLLRPAVTMTSAVEIESIHANYNNNKYEYENESNEQQQQQHQQHGTTNDTAQSTAPRKKNRVRCLRWNRNELIDLLETDKGIATALKAALSWDIVRKLKRQRHMLTEGRVKNPTAWTKKREEQGSARYAAILQNTLMQQETEERKDVSEMLTKYRMIHHIEDADHERALARCGWTDEEFREGKKRRVEVEDEYDEEDDVGTEELQSAQWRRVKRYSSKVVRSLLQ
mmetsp:Transcript_6106/g.13357  ORF Transcript_6106/g.13357 Transcript_6106/m.13357 type:complete len:314 (+) Transcript_6106:112-1053(+)